jgi:glucose/arabinose dehydrogenase
MSGRSGDWWTRRALPALLAVAVLALALSGAASRRGVAAAASTTLPSGFQDTTVISGLSRPTNIRWASDGRIFVAEKSGLILEFDSLADSTPTVVADLTSLVDDYWDRGLLGLAIDPNFATSPYIYALYTYDAPPGQTAPVWNDACPTPPGPTTDGCPVTGKLVRIQVSAGSTMVGSPTTLVSNEWCQQYPSHSVGDLQFGPDGMLYVTGGDGASFTFADFGEGGGSAGSGIPANPCGDPPGGVGGIESVPTAEGGSLRSQSLRRAAGEPVLLNGALLRLDPATGEPAPGNPNSGAASIDARRIIAYGFRNPFRFVFRPGSSEIWVGDVGADTWEEIDRLASPTTVTNFGWPCYEGMTPYPAFSGAFLNVCTSLYTAGTATGPYFEYNHNATVVSGDGCPTSGGSVTSGLAFYSGSAFPASYNGALFFTDHSRQCIWVMFPGQNGLPDPNNVKLFENLAPNPVDLEQTPDGNLVYVDHDDGTIHELTYVSQTCANGTFTAQYFNNTTLAGNPVVTRCESAIDDNWGSGSPDTTINTDGFSARWTGNVDFSAGTYTFTASTDDGTRVWVDNHQVMDDWQNQSLTTSTGSVTLAAGTHTIKVEYFDNTGDAEAHVSWAVGANTPPTPVIDGPAGSTTWAVGDLVQFSGHAVDPQDGTLPASTLNWTLALHHCTTPTACHVHDLQTWTGVTSGSFNAPDHGYPSYLELTLTATDSGGLSTVTSVSLQPKTVNLSFATNPSGVTVSVGGATQATPLTVTVIQGSQNSISAPLSQTLGATTYTFGSWSDGGAATHLVTAPAGGASYVATYTAQSSGGGGGGGGSAAKPDLRLAWSARVPQVDPGGLEDLTATVTNAGDGSAVQTHLSFTLPPSVQLVGPPTSQIGSGCTGTQSVDCYLDFLAGHGTTTVVVEVRALTAGAVTIPGTVTTNGEANPADNSASVTFQVTTPAPPAGPPPTSGGRITVSSVSLSSRLVPGRRAAASLTISRGRSDPLRPSRMSCTVHVAGRAVTPLKSYRSGRVSCAFTIPRKTRRGSTVAGSIVVTTARGKTRRDFHGVVH